jgi:uncharacterized delta-60 repeat protein
MFEVYGQLIRAQLQLSATDLTPTATGLIYFNTASKVVKWYDGDGNWKVAVDTNTQQTLLNKILTSPVVTNTINLDNNASISFYETGNANKITLRAPSSFAADYNLILPSAQGTPGSYLENNGSGSLSWTPATGVAFDPTALSDVLATKLGYKSYIQNTAYNGGVVLSVNSTMDGPAQNAEFIPYQTQNGSWRLKGNIPSTVRGVFNSTIGTAANSSVYDIVQQSDGKVLVGGAFTTWAGTAGRNRLVRLNADGTLDTAFQTNIGTAANNVVTSILIQSTGKIIVTGSFTTWNGLTRAGIVRLNSDGTEDAAFYTNFSAGVTSSSLTKSVLTSTDKIILYTSSIPIGTNVGTINVGGTLYWFIRLNSDGSIDNTFFKGSVGNNVTSLPTLSHLELDTSGNIYINGSFSQVTTQAGTFDVNTVSNQYCGVAKLDPNNANIDSTFRTNWSASPLSSGANFDTNNPAVYSSGMCIDNANSKIVFWINNGIWSVTTSGLSLNVNRSTTGSVDEIVLQSDGKYLIGGAFTILGGASQNRLARLNSNLQTDTAFSTNLGTGIATAGNVVWKIAVVNYSPGILVGGSFTAVNGITKNNIAKILTTGTVQPTTNTTNTDTITGVTFVAVGNQAVTATVGAAQAVYSEAVASTGNVLTTSSAAISTVGSSFDVELNSKPTWAY